MLVYAVIVRLDHSRLAFKDELNNMLFPDCFPKQFIDLGPYSFHSASYSIFTVLWCSSEAYEEAVFWIEKDSILEWASYRAVAIVHLQNCLGFQHRTCLVNPRFVEGASQRGLRNQVIVYE